jgi:hypothetical protein
MKIFTSLALLLFINASMISQLQINGAQDLYTGTSVEDYIDIQWSVTNTSDNWLSLRVERYEVDAVDGADGNFCWGLLCIPWTAGDYTTASEIVDIAPGGTDNSFRASYRPQGNAGASTYQYCFIEIASPDIQPICHTVTFSVDGSVSIDESEFAKASITLAPNPVSNLGRLNYSFDNVPTNGKITFYNMTGAKVKEVGIYQKNGLVYFDNTDFAPGVYVCNLENDGVIQESIRMVVQ